MNFYRSYTFMKTFSSSIKQMLSDNEILINSTSVDFFESIQSVPNSKVKTQQQISIDSVVLAC